MKLFLHFVILLFVSKNIFSQESAANDYIRLYQKHISHIRGHSCPMYPSCSNYALNAFQKSSFPSALIIGSDRLLRCGHDHKFYSRTRIDNQVKLIDFPIDAKPLENFSLTNKGYYYAYSDTTRDDSAIVFIKSLINNQYHSEALLEILRYNQNSRYFSIEVFINKVICLIATEQYEKALYDYELKCPDEFKKHPELSYQIALIQYKLNSYDLALKASSIALNACTDSFCQSKVLFLNGILYAKKFDWANTINTYKSLSAIMPNSDLVKANLQISNGTMSVKTKKPSIAACLSIIPGVGYAYAGHKQTAISAFIVNGLLAYATYSNLKLKNYGMAVLTGVFNLSFYISNIYGSAKSAKRYNEAQRQTIIDKLEYNSNL
ncbi:MAG: membrane protein insertion efficiency factor YidD [Flavobacteriales bacterium]|nr:membrane protein insertion efficiency factor YidD [Flavobacteriales bacterium]